MGDKYKVMAAEKNGSELLDLTEVPLTAQNTEFDNTSNGFVASDVQAAIEEAKIRYYSLQLHKTRSGSNTFSNGGWWDIWPSQYAFGSYSGFATSCYPLIVPFNCKIKKIQVIFRRANFDYNINFGTIRFDLQFYDLPYNGANAIDNITVEFGNFNTNTTNDGNWDFTIPEESLILTSGDNRFAEGLILGARFVKSASGNRAINSFVNPMLRIELEEVL